MKLKIVAMVCFFALLLAGAALAPEAVHPDFPKSTMRIDLAGGQHIDFTIEVARSAEEQEYGLMFRRHLQDHAGMIFLESPPRIMTMWMKNTLIPLDMLFVNADGTIASISPDAVPESETIISSGQPVRAVIELAGGTAVKLGIAPGDKVVSPVLDENQP